jgi:hypothetical protein
MNIITEAFETESGFIFQAFIPGDMPDDMPLAEGVACASAADAVDSLLSVLGIR